MKNKITISTFIVLLSLFAIPNFYASNKVDLNHLNNGGYGYLLKKDSVATVWWAEGAYKVLRDAPIPRLIKNEITLSAAKNEFESFIVIVSPMKKMEHFRVSVSDFVSSFGHKIVKENIEVREVDYVKVNPPTDYYGYQGYFPDPLPLFENNSVLSAAENNPLWITLKVDKTAKPGLYRSELVLTAAGGWQVKVPISLKVRTFELPSTPTLRSGWGMNMSNVAEYENLKSHNQKATKFEKYMEMFSRYKISPYDPFEFSPIHETILGVDWQGGFYDRYEKTNGTYSYKVVDESSTENIEATTRHLIPISSNHDYIMKWQAKGMANKQTFVVGVECYNAEKELLTYENRFEQYQATSSWQSYELPLGVLNQEIKYIKIILSPVNRTLEGEDKGGMWFDDLSINNSQKSNNILTCGNFEIDSNAIDIQLDFTAFEKASKLYFSEKYGFNAFRLKLHGLGSGTYYSRKKGTFEGFEQGTDEYNKLMKSYLQQIQSNLERIGIIDKAYIYWFDEPGEQDYEFVYETNKMIKTFAPRLTTFLTEHIAGKDISDVTDISCTIWHQLNHEKIRKMNERGLQHWSYLCVWPKAPWISEFIDHDAINMRMWIWASYVHSLSGILMWETTYWNSEAASPKGYLQNPWEHGMSWVNGYGWPLGKQTIWGNGDGRYFYPQNRKPNADKTTVYDGYPIPSIRLEFLRDGIEDYEYLVLLQNLMNKSGRKQLKLRKEATELLRIPETIYTNEKTYTKNPQILLQYREKIADLIERFGIN